MKTSQKSIPVGLRRADKAGDDVISDVMQSGRDRMVGGAIVARLSRSKLMAIRRAGFIAGPA